MVRGFTLIELLVVVVIIVVLLALLTPALDQAIVRTELTICAARHKGLSQIFNQYAAEQKRKYPSGKRSSDGYEHLPFVPHYLVKYVEQAAGNNNSALTAGDVKWGVVPDMLTDPSFEESFGYRHETYGYVIGYAYLAGHPALEKANNGTNGFPQWRSAMGLADRGDGEMTVCWNSWTLGTSPVEGVMIGQWTIVAHAEGGAALGNEPPVGGHFYHANSGRDPRTIGSIGGNVGFVDGSVAWRDIADMHERVAASSNGEQNTSYPALW
jgi:prepilin-type N-terminal cleavage/methylation domain-containing protein/prepilin-type processing-associated H-X9-DG protein